MLLSSLAQASVLALGLPGGMEWVIILVIGVLLFGKRLPDIARGLGKSIVEFKKGVKGIEDDVEGESSRPAARLDDRTADQRPLSSTTASRPAEPIPSSPPRGDGV